MEKKWFCITKWISGYTKLPFSMHEEKKIMYLTEEELLSDTYSFQMTVYNELSISELAKDGAINRKDLVEKILSAQKK